MFSLRILATAIVLLCISPAMLRAAVFDYTPQFGIISAAYVGGASGNVQLSVSGQHFIQVPTTQTQDPLVDKGVVAWTSSSRVYYYVFDPIRTNWVGDSAEVPAFAQDLKVADGIVAWSTSAGAFFRAYDPARRTWVNGTEAGTVQSPGVENRSGVVSGVRPVANGYTIFYFTYDPTPGRAGWMRGSANIASPTSSPSDLTSGDGIVAWSINLGGVGQHRMFYRIYDPRLGTWRDGQQDTGFPIDLTIANSLVTWSAGGNFFKGYNGPSSTWGSDNTLPVPLAYFFLSTNSGNAAFNVSFIDLSIGANSWLWNFGDGSSSGSRAVTHSYTTFGRFDASLTAANTVYGGSSTSNRTILTDTIVPSGTIAINGTTSGGFTTNRNVTLSLTVTDNSPANRTMRVSNEGTNWTDWLAFQPTLAWQLPTNNGVRTVSAQFRDAALNTSATVSASIVLDTSPVPIASVNSTNLSEGAGSVELVVVLDHVYSQTVIINYSASNGTAIAGADFNVTAGTLTFPPNTISRPLPISIINDGLVELNETFSIHLSTVTNAVINNAGTVTILDNDDALVSFLRTNNPAVESNLVASFDLRLSAASGRPVSVFYQTTTNGTATPEFDFVPRAGFVVFQPGQTNQFINVVLNDDPLDEYPETIELQLLRATNGILSGPSIVIATITDDDKPLVSFTQRTSSILEPTNAAAVLRFAVRLSKPFFEEVAAEVAVDGITATPGLDYNQPFSNIRLTYSPGETNKEIAVTLFGDNEREFLETIRLSLLDFFKVSAGTFPVLDIIITDADAPPFMTTPVVSTNGQFTATFTGYPGQVFAVECTSNFINWTELVRLTNTTGTLVYSQSFATNTAGRFYRTRLIP